MAELEFYIEWLRDSIERRRGYKQGAAYWGKEADRDEVSAGALQRILDFCRGQGAGQGVAPVTPAPPKAEDPELRAALEDLGRAAQRVQELL